MTGVNEGPYGITDPQLWVVDESVPPIKLSGTEILYDTNTPAWSSALYVQLGEEGRVCFQIRDDWPTEDPPLLHSGCGLISAGSVVEQSVSLSNGVTLFVSICLSPLLPPSPPLLHRSIGVDVQ